MRKTVGLSYGLLRGRAAAARVAHNHKVAGSSPAPATKKSARPCDGYFSWNGDKIRVKKVR